jgi:hypothetical protein
MVHHINVDSDFKVQRGKSETEATHHLPSLYTDRAPTRKITPDLTVSLSLYNKCQ